MSRRRWFALAAPLAATLLMAGCSGDAPTRAGAEPPPGSGEPEDDTTSLPTLHQEGGAGSSGGRPPAEAIPGQLVVDVEDTLDLATFHARWGTSTILAVEDTGFLLVDADDDEAWTLAAGMIGSGDCTMAEPNYELESPESNQGVVAFYEAGHIFSDVVDQAALTRIGAPLAHIVSTGTGVVVGIVDTGIDASHPDLAGSVLAGWDFVDGDGDATDFADGIDQDLDGLTDEAAGHGTHVAGIVHAIAPDAMLLPVRALDTEGVGTSVGVARAIRWAVDHGADVVNLSLGMSAQAGVVHDAVQYAENSGVVVVASAGNAGKLVHNHYPAKFSNVIGVAATDANDLKAAVSSFGSYVAISAPGEGILSTYLGGGYAVWTGTSFSAPMVSAGAAIWLAISPALRDAQGVAEAVEESAYPLNHVGLPYDEEMGEGRLDLGKLVLETGED
ncbi:MAG: S8 family peptidase [Candidatus Eiseniibacteriota bacterium]